jgi:tetratricopeptide (TPR) repeat protein
MSLGSMVLAVGLLAGCASGPTPEELAAKAEAERQEAIQKRAEDERKRAEAARKQAESKAILAKVSAIELAGQALEANGKLREAFKQYLAALETLGVAQAPDVEFRLRERIVKSALRLDPAPAVPEEAERHMVFGGTALKEAKSVDDYKRASDEFDKALRAAPWWGAAYFNLGVVQEQARDYKAAGQSLRLYLLSAPDGPDRKDVQAKIYELEYKYQNSPAERLAGIWVGHLPRNVAGWYYTRVRIEGMGRDLKIIKLDKEEEVLLFQGTVQNSSVSGKFFYVPAIYKLCDTDLGGSRVVCDMPKTYSFKGEIGKDGRSLELSFDMPELKVESARLLGDGPLYVSEKGRTWHTDILTREE